MVDFVEVCDVSLQEERGYIRRNDFDSKLLVVCGLVGIEQCTQGLCRP